ncbi:MAG: hypothetical protein HY875_06650 [Chloroflexi bacterium]|nr:hypothetical protein [Chloroflexota bacterium]
MKTRSILAGFAAVLALGAGVAVAQYPAPGGNITTTVATGNPATGSTTEVTVTVADSAGVAAAGVACTATVGSQPGSGASVFPAAFTTDAAGLGALTVTTGDSPGQVRIDITCGQISATASIPVGGLTPGFVPAPPNTGTGTAGGDGGFPYTVLASVAVVLVVGAGSAVVRRGRSSR